MGKQNGGANRGLLLFIRIQFFSVSLLYVLIITNYVTFLHTLVCSSMPYRTVHAYSIYLYSAVRENAVPYIVQMRTSVVLMRNGTVRNTSYNPLIWYGLCAVRYGTVRIYTVRGAISGPGTPSPTLFPLNRNIVMKFRVIGSKLNQIPYDYKLSAAKP